MNTTTPMPSTTSTTAKNGHDVKPSLASRVAEKIDPHTIADGVKNLPQIIQREVRDNPYRTLGIAAGVGFGVGALVSSKLLRVLLVTAGGYAVNEIVRRRIKSVLDELE